MFLQLVLQTTIGARRRSVTRAVLIQSSVAFPTADFFISFHWSLPMTRLFQARTRLLHCTRHMHSCVCTCLSLVRTSLSVRLVGNRRLTQLQMQTQLLQFINRLRTLSVVYTEKAAQFNLPPSLLINCLPCTASNPLTLKTENHVLPDLLSL